MKKIGIILSLVLVAACLLSAVAFAAGASFGIAASKTTAKAGDEVTITASIKENPGVWTVAAYISYDPAVFEQVSKDDSGVITRMSEAADSAGKAVFDLGDVGNVKDVTVTGTIGSVVLKVKADAPAGKTTISIINDESYNASDDEVAFTPASVEVTIEGAAPPHTHTLTKTDAVEATCDKEGNIAYWTCSECGKIFKDAEGKNEIKMADTVVAKKDHTWDAGAVTKEATCEEKGVKTYTCTVCGKTKTEDIAAKGHSWDEGTITKEATCEEKGVKTYTCKNDSSHTKTEDIAAKGHDWDEGTITKEATCEEKGVKTYTCKNDSSHTKTEDIAAKGHDWDEGKVTTEPTYDAEGVKTFTCKNDPAHTRNESIAKLEPKSVTYDKGKDAMFEPEVEYDEIVVTDESGKPIVFEMSEVFDADGRMVLKSDFLTKNPTVIVKLQAAGKTVDAYKVSPKGAAPTPAPTNNGGGSQGNNKGSDNPKTGDSSNIALWAVLFALCGGTAVVLLPRKKEN